MGNAGMKPARQRNFRLPLWLTTLFAVLIFSGIPSVEATPKDGVMKTYRSMMARSCRIKQKKPDVSANVFNQIQLSEKWIRIRRVQKGWKGWVRVHAVCRVPGGTAWGYADLQLKSGEVICESDNWDSMITPPHLANR